MKYVIKAADGQYQTLPTLLKYQEGREIQGSIYLEDAHQYTRLKDAEQTLNFKWKEDWKYSKFHISNGARIIGIELKEIEL